ncbi:hypothetical protein CFP65_6786 [Kitasatospora sp. MMS16-BH015]|uniref:PRC and DUF2382 domain-containing protein n=1 Tax=Kitasatospora sp. MMS16-BH015 TaxID=2018025 RepID=UPI000CA29CBB|nr:PRC and DUF2382 domain-containing protein [Kitasatospora sp. MMS16-BH015]AUG81424.1 hypothetical protein CFP65_6786 [Kitasatospora sp. MMS16-BH015]
MQTDIDPRDLIGHKAVDRNGDKIGTVDEVYLDDATGEPEWAAVRTGIFGRDAFVPLTTSEFSGEELKVPYDKALIKESPDFGVGQHLSPAQELQLYRYYGLETTGTPAAPPAANGTPAADHDFGTVRTAAAAAATTQAPAPAAAPTPPPPTPSPAPLMPEATPMAFTTPVRDHDKTAPAAPMRPVNSTASPTLERPAAPAPSAATSAPSGPVEITCREERLDITTEWQVTYTARLRKYVTSETVERHVPVVRERVRVERVPVSDGERDALTQEEIAEAVEEVTLQEERPVVHKYLVPIERVRLVVERYTDDHVVREELRREQVEIQDDPGADFGQLADSPPPTDPGHLG